MGAGIRLPYPKRRLEMAPVLDIDKFRRQIPALDQSIYMNTGGSGPMPRSAIDVIRDTYETAGSAC